MTNTLYIVTVQITGDNAAQRLTKIRARFLVGGSAEICPGVFLVQFISTVRGVIEESKPGEIEPTDKIWMFELGELALGQFPSNARQMLEAHQRTFFPLHIPAASASPEVTT